MVVHKRQNISRGIMKNYKIKYQKIFVEITPYLYLPFDHVKHVKLFTHSGTLVTVLVLSLIVNFYFLVIKGGRKNIREEG